LQVLLVRLLFNLRLALRNRFLVTAVRTRQESVLRLEKKIGAAGRTRIMLDFAS